MWRLLLGLACIGASCSHAQLLHGVADRVYGALVGLVDVHVMEKCCPYVSRYAIGRYPGEWEAHGWVPALTMRVFPFHARHTHCWKIANATQESHVWSRIDTRSVFKSSQAFCLPASDESSPVSIHYIQRRDNTASYITQPLWSVDPRKREISELAGWTRSNDSTFLVINPPAYYYWRAVAPLRLISHVWLYATVDASRVDCPRAQAVPINLNHGFPLEPIVFFCVKYAPVRAINPWLNVTGQERLDYLVSLHASSKCSEHSEQVKLLIDDHDEGNRSRPAIPNNYKMLDAKGLPLVYCMRKCPLVEHGRAVPAYTFVQSLHVDVTRLRRYRLNTKANSPSVFIAKQSP